MKAQLRKAGRFKATHAVIRGEDELNKGTVVVKNLVESQQMSFHSMSGLRI